MKTKIAFITLWFIFLNIIFFQNIYSCTAFRHTEKNILIGKNLDWAVGDGFIVKNIVGSQKQALVVSDKEPVIWFAKYGSITFNQFGKDFPLGGMNEKGLVIEELSYSPTKYPSSENLKSINEFQWIQYQLDNYSTTDEVIANLDNLQISKLMFGLHYIVCDNSSNMAIIEFINGKTYYYSDEEISIPILSNNSYRNSLNYLQKHKGFGGDKIISNKSGSQERFIRVANMLKYHQDAFTILDSVKQVDTQWSIVYDITTKSIYYKTKHNSNIQSIHLNNFDFSNNEQFKLLTDKIEKKFKKFTFEDNAKLLKNVFKKMVVTEQLEQKEAARFLMKFLDYIK